MIAEFVRQLEQRARAEKRPGDYEQDGILHCGKCHTPRQCRVNLCGTPAVVGCMCACESQQYREERERQRQEDERIRVKNLRDTGIADRSLRGCRFESAEPSPLLEKCRRYAGNWEKFQAENTGLLLWGDTGGGKTFAAACIANELIDRGVPAAITSFPRVLASGWDERAEFLRQVGKFPLLILDDLGAERETEMALETVYAVIDERYKSGKPLIVTTNLPLRAIQSPGDLAHRRIYDRLLEMCIPVAAGKADYRGSRAREKMSAAQRLLTGEGGQT